MGWKWSVSGVEVGWKWGGSGAYVLQFPLSISCICIPLYIYSSSCTPNFYNNTMMEYFS